MSQEEPDEALMLAYGAGDAGAFERLYSRHKGPLYRFVLRQTDGNHVDELFQDIWMKVINARQNYRHNAGFKTWLYRIARNRIIDHYRRTRIRAVTGDTPVESVADNSSHRPDAHADIMARHQLLLDALTTLPHEQREAFLLHEEAGLAVNEIADITGISYEAAKSRLRYAISKLRERIEAGPAGAAK
jgi:RNA polymerase sigma-70 factor (ECF subfamily)